MRILNYAVLLALVLGAGCGKKEPELRSEKVIPPDEKDNELFVEAVGLVSKAKSEESSDIPAAIKSYEEALVKVRKIVNEYKRSDEYKKSDLAVKLVSGETLFTGKSMEQITERVDELQRELTHRAEEEKRRAEGEKRKAEEEKRRAEARRRVEEKRKALVKKLLRWEFETGGDVYSSPAIGPDGTVYVGSSDKKLYALSGKSGVKLWEFET
ncbi:uncharacterized protein METZ01_LOCUS353280, partial [marine metagenome]